MALPNTGITTTMVGQELGVSTRDVGSLCTHPAINMWSKRKPVREKTNHPLTSWISTNSNWGIKFEEKVLPVKSYDCAYERPEGTANSPYRLSDFRGYERRAEPKLLIKNIPNEINKLVDSSITSDFENSGSLVQIDLNDLNISPLTPITYPDQTILQKVTELKIGCEIVDENTVVKTIYGDKILSDVDGMKFTINVSDVPIGFYELRFFLYPLSFHQRRFPFPSTPLYPNTATLVVTEVFPFVINSYQFQYKNAFGILMPLQLGTVNYIDSLDGFAVNLTLDTLNDVNVSYFDLSFTPSLGVALKDSNSTGGINNNVRVTREFNEPYDLSYSEQNITLTLKFAGEVVLEELIKIDKQ